MFEFQPSISEGDALKKRIASKDTDSTPEQPENTDVVNVSQDAPEEEATELEAQAENEVTPETEEQATEEEAQDEETDLFYYDIDGEEVSSDQLKEWKSNGLMQADYTRKTQELSESRKAFDNEKEEFNAKQSSFNEKLAQLNAIIDEDTPSEETLAEWREYEPEKYIEYTEKQSKRKKLLAESKADLPTNSVDMAKVSAELFANHPEWMDNGQQSQKFKDDTNLMTQYAETRGIGQKELASFEAKHYEVMLDAARYQSTSKSNAAIEKKVRKAPVSTKPKKATTSKVATDIQAAKAKFMKTGNNTDYVEYKKLARAAQQ